MVSKFRNDWLCVFSGVVATTLMCTLRHQIQISDCKIEENNGFLKYVCPQEDLSKSKTRYKCLYSNEFYAYEPDQSSLFTNDFSGKACSNDPHFYQACDIREGKVTNNDILCEYYLCHYTIQYLWGDSNELQPSSKFGGEKCSLNCYNTDINKEGCDDEKTALPSGDLARPDDICNEVCDIQSCEDEASCNGYLYGMYCEKNKKLNYVSVNKVCNIWESCDDERDEKNCTVTPTTENYCKHHATGKIVPVHNYTRCSPIKRSDYKHWSGRLYCKLEDVPAQQTNCSDLTRIALFCKINGYQSSVSKYLICFDDEISACDDHIDSACYATNSCRIHKHLLCDEKKDCIDNWDETHPTCFSKTKYTCKRRVGVKRELPIPTAWLKDGVEDCADGIDETANWTMCGVGKTSRYKSSLEEKCENVFVCRTGSPGFELIRNFCDGLESCGNENKICSVAIRSETLTTTVSTSNRGLTKTLSYCLKGLENLEVLFHDCVNTQFIFPKGEIFGVDVTTSIILPNNKQSCDYMYGEQYLYRSCTGRCKEASCPLRNIPRYEFCPNHVPDRVGTIVNNKYLIFVTKSYGNVFTNRYFVCDDKIKCIDYSKVCDLVKDCDDGSDEEQCTNHFKCNSSGKLLPKTKKCDGHIDCVDLSDECNVQCSRAILEGTILKGLSWLLGLLAVAANLVIIGKSFKTIKQCKTSVALINRLLIIMIALGDFLIGCYLFVIATYDAVIFRQGYCRKQVEWITSLECSIIGVFSTIGSQISLFSMTGLSLVRIHGIWNSMRIPGEVTMVKILKITAAVLAIFLASATIAVIPLVGTFEDFFANGVKFSDDLHLFVGTPDKATVTKVIQAYYGRTKDATLRWEMLIEMVRNMFSHDFDYTDLTEKVEKLDFYGNDGVCLFKYFVQKQDPQRLFVWSILSLNFICFVFISISYLVIGILSRRSSKSVASSNNNQQIAKRNSRMNRRITIIITTDFLCWIPFIVTCVLHSLEVIDATPWYAVFSMIILPINSVINPFLYDDALGNAVKAPIRSLKTRVTNSALFQSICQIFTARTSEDVGLERRDMDVGNTGTTFAKETGV